MLRYQIATRTTILCLTIFLSMGQSNSVFAQESAAAPYEKIIQSMNLPGSETDPAQKAQTYSMAAIVHLGDGNLEKATERIEQALQMCRDQKLEAATPYALLVAAQVMKKMDPDGAAKFLKEQLHHPNASAAFKKEVYKALGQEQQLSGNFVSSIASSKAALDAVQKESPGSIEEAEALLDYGKKCLTAKFFDLGLDPLKRAKELGVKLNRYDISNRAAYQVAIGLLSINKDQEAAEVLIEQIESIGNSGNHLLLPQIWLELIRVQTRLEDFDAAAKTIEDAYRKTVTSDGSESSFTLSLKAPHLFAKAVAEGSLEATVPKLIKLLEDSIERRIRHMDALKEMTKDQPTSNSALSWTDFQNVPDLLSLAAFKSIAGMDDSAMKTLDKTSVAIDSLDAFYEKTITSSATGLDEARILITDQRAAVAEIRQMILVRNGKSEEALVVAEQSRGVAQTELLKRRLGIEQTNDQPETIDVQQIQAIADTQNTTLVYFSLVHALDPATRDFFKKSHTVNSPQSLYTWVVRPNQKIEFISQDLPVRINELVSAARDEIMAVAGEDYENQAIPDEEDVLTNDVDVIANDVDVVRQLTRSPQTIVIPENDTDALRQLYQLLIEPIEKWLPESPTEVVTFVPQGNLFVLPFAALTDADDEPLIAKHTLSISPSAQLLALADQEFQSVKQKDNQDIVIVGNPTMPSYQLRPDEDAVQLSPLPGAEAEANNIAELFKVKAICGDAADERSVVKAMQNAKYIHLATHGILEADNSYAQSYLSSLALAPSEGEDGFLTVRETMRLNLHAEMAVLSGCDTGRGRISGDGVVGLARGYISSGVPTVVVSLWPVSDNSTAVLMSLYYEGLLDGEGKAAALRKAMLKTRERFPRPYAWAAFTLYGYGR